MRKLALLLSLVVLPLAFASAEDAASITVFATGLDNPRGLEFGSDGALYVAEGGRGGTNSTVGSCDQVVPPVGPYTGGRTGRISRISPAGVRSTVVDELPSSQTSPALGSLVSGVADVAFVGRNLYALLAGAGCSHGVPDVPNGVIRVNGDGTWSLVANLSAFYKSHPVENPEPADFEPDGTSYSMVAVRGALYVVEPNMGALDRVTPAGKITRVIDISASEGHVVPTSVAYRGNFFVGNLGRFPIEPGTQHIYKITPSGKIKIWASGLTAVLGVAFDDEGRLYALETSTVAGFPTPETGRIVRVSRAGVMETIASGLTFPTAMTFGPDGALYVSNYGFGFPPGAGQIVRVALPDEDDDGDDDADNEDD
jgi:hypothetical protein